jgi:hypothetical protein
MKEIILLECVHGYEFELQDGQIRYHQVEGPVPNAQDVLPLFQEISANRNLAIEYLQSRCQPLDIAEHLWRAAEKAQYSAIQAENQGGRELARKNWQRSRRLFAGAAKTYGVLEPHIPWNEWVTGCGMETVSGDEGEV